MDSVISAVDRGLRAVRPIDMMVSKLATRFMPQSAGVRSADGSRRMIKRIAQLTPDGILVSADDPLGTDSQTPGLGHPVPYEKVAGIVLERGLFSGFRRSRRSTEEGE